MTSLSPSGKSSKVRSTLRVFQKTHKKVASHKPNFGNGEGNEIRTEQEHTVYTIFPD
jgi:hypothetical protein